MGGSSSHHVGEDEAGVGQLEVFDQTVELPAVEGAPGTVEVVSGLRLLLRVAVVLKLDGNTREVRRTLTNNKIEQLPETRWD